MMNRLHVFARIVNGDSYDSILNLAGTSASKRGFLYETIVEILVVSRCIPAFNDWTEIFKNHDGRDGREKVTDIINFLNKPCHQGSDRSDITFKIDDQLCAISVKHTIGFDPTESGLIQFRDKTTKLGYVCRDKNLVISRRFKHTSADTEQIYKTIEKNGFLLDESDIKKSYSIFQARFAGKDVLDIIQNQYLKITKKNLFIRAHQKYAINCFVKNMTEKYHVLEHVPRSGKSIVILCIIMEMIRLKGYKKFLIITPVTATVSQFVENLAEYYEFSGIPYIKQKDFTTKWATGIAICSIQYFKAGNIKYLNGIDMIISDEAHIGSATELSQEKIFRAPSVKTVILSSGTPGTTPSYFSVSSMCIYKWSHIDNMMMKNIKYDHFHPAFKKFLREDRSVSTDYSHCPSNIYLKSVFDTGSIKEYNSKHGTDLGFSWPALFALTSDKKNLELAMTPDGRELLMGFLSTIISNDKNTKTVLKRIEKCQVLAKSRTDNKLIIMFLPTHTKDSPIAEMQLALQKFINETGIWAKYDIIFDNAEEKHNNSVWLNNKIKEAVKIKKRGCVLFLGEKSTIGVTYDHCDATIHLDNTHSIDNHRQKLARSGTGENGKTAYVTVDMNVQRAFGYCLKLAIEAKKVFKSDTLSDALEKLHTENIFMMDMDDIIHRSDHYKNIINEAFNSPNGEKDLLENIEYLEDDLTMLSGQYTASYTGISQILNGENPELPDGTATATRDCIHEKIDKIEKEKREEFEMVINKTRELFVTFLIPLSALMSIKFKVLCAMNHPEAFSEIMKILCEKDDGLKISHADIISWTWSKMVKLNQEIVDQIHEIYRVSDYKTLRERISNHFIPTPEEKKDNAEIPTPKKLVDEMLAKIPGEFWISPKRVLEPCCGKGNFVLGIYDCFFAGLAEMYPDESERRQIIVEDCLWFGDISPLNVLITTELLRRYSYGFESSNNFVGDTLEKTWDFQFDAVIGNPPYQQKVGPKKTKTIWDKFIIKSLTLLKSSGYLVFVHPSGWRNIDGKFKTIQMEILSRDLQYLEIHNEKDGLKTFNSETRYDWYVLKNEKVDTSKTIIKFQDGTTNTINVTGLEFIPNGEYEKIMSMVAKNGEENVEVIYSRSLYGTDKKHMSRTKTEEYKYPCVYTVNSKSEITYYYSSKQHGHYEVPKFIWSNGRISSIGSYVDINGDYGLTQFAYAIVDKPENLQKIKEVFDTKDFRNLMELCAVGQLTVNYKVISIFKKDFWKEFISE